MKRFRLSLQLFERLTKFPERFQETILPEVLAPENLPFAVALAMLGLLVLVQILGLGHLIDHADADIDSHSDVADVGGGLVSLLGIGRVPLLVWLSCFLASFALLGLSVQHFVMGLFGAPFPALAATGAGLAVAVPANSVLTRLIGTVWPRDETTAVPVEALLGKRGRIVVGTASRDNPARAVVHDVHGQMHNVMVEPHDDGVSLTEGCEVLLVRREGEIFYALDGNGPIRLGE